MMGEYVKGDGKHDDTSGIKKALQYIENSKDTNILFFPAGIYLISETLYLPSGVIIQGSGRPATTQVKGTIFKRSKNITIFNGNGEESSYANPYINVRMSNVSFIDSVNASFTSPKVKLTKCHYFLIENCVFVGGVQHLQLSSCFDSRILNTDFQDGGNVDSQIPSVELVGNTANAIEVNNQIIFDNCRFEYYKYTGLFIGQHNNEIWLKTCKFESVSLKGVGQHIKFQKAGTITLDVQICGKQQDVFMDFEKTNHVYGVINFEHFQINEAEPFNTPIIKTNTCRGLTFALLGDLNGHYSLNYLVENTGNTTNANIITDTNKKVTNDNTVIEAPKFNSMVTSFHNLPERTGFVSRRDLDSNDSWITGQVLDEGGSLQWRLVHNKNGELIIPFLVSNDGTIRFNKNIVCSGTVTPMKTKTRPWGNDGMTYVDSSNGTSRVYTNINSNWVGFTKMSNPPTEGTWRRDDIVYNTNVTPGSFIGWVCTTAGTPGTWKGFGKIEE